jgi:hypothetical protein
MFKEVLFKLLDMWRVLKKPNWTVIKTGSYTDGTPYTVYVYNGKRYVHVGHDFPPKRSSFSLPIRKALVGNLDVTSKVKTFIGPVGGDIPPAGYMFYRKKFFFFVSLKSWTLRIGFKQRFVKGEDEEVKVQNILGHWSILDARKN